VIANDFLWKMHVISLKNTKKGTIVQILLSDSIYVAAVYYRAKYHSTVGYSMSCWAMIVLKLPHHIKFSASAKEAVGDTQTFWLK